jgi:transposase
VDAGKFHHALVARDARGRDSKPLLFATNREGFITALHRIRQASGGAAPGDVIVGIEFAGVYGATFAHYLAAEGYNVVSVLGATTKAWGKAVHGTPLKTDAKDAITIVDLVSHGRFSGYPFLRPEYAQLRLLATGARRLSVLRAAVINRLRSVLQSVWPEYESHFDSFAQRRTPLLFLAAFPGPEALLAATKRRSLTALQQCSQGQHGVEKLEELRQSAQDTVAIPGAEAALDTEILQLVAHANLLANHRDALDAKMAEVMRDLPEAAALRTIPFVSTRAAATFLGAIGDVQAYASVNQVLRLAGLNLITRESGILVGTHRISKRGRPEIRHAAYLTALGLVKEGGLFRDQYERAIKRNGGKKKKALVAISRDVVRLMFSIARDKRSFTKTPPRRRTEVPAI